MVALNMPFLLIIIQKAKDFFVEQIEI